MHPIPAHKDVAALACHGYEMAAYLLMSATRALSKRNIENGYVLACQSRPSSNDPIWLDFDL